MEPHELAIAAKYIGAGLAAIGTGAAGIGVGTLFGQFLNGALRNPSAAEGQFGRLIFGFAVSEALGIFALLIPFLLLFAVGRARVRLALREGARRDDQGFERGIRDGRRRDTDAGRSGRRRASELSSVRPKHISLSAGLVRDRLRVPLLVHVQAGLAPARGGDRRA